MKSKIILVITFLSIVVVTVAYSLTSDIKTEKVEKSTNISPERICEVLESLSVVNNTNSIDSLYRLSIEHKGDFVSCLIKYKSLQAAKYLKKTSSDLTSSEWFSVLRAYRGTKARDEDINNFFIEQISTNSYDRIREELSIYYRLHATYSDAIKLSNYLSTERKEGIRISIYFAMSRYSVDEFNSKIISDLFSDPQSYITKFIVGRGFKRYCRYDLLPELIKLYETLTAEKDIIKLSQYDALIKAMDEVIPYLEQKKKENASIGLPLDWGVVKDE